ncbi:MAG TPA: hypothetical protein VKA26_13005 [Ignavibacteriaceae bacterium]|nr:hypothetical protein [Ignavibacteriaceae bacterium]
MKRKTKVRLSLIVGFVAFFFAGWDSLDQNYLILAIANFILAGANIVSFFYIKEKASTVNIFLLMLNACLAFIVAYGYFEAGKKGLPVVWIIVGLLNIIVALKTIKKKKLNLELKNITNE